MSHHHSHSEHPDHQEHANHPEAPKHQNEFARAPVDAPEADAAEHASRPVPQKPEGLVVDTEAPLLPTDHPVVKPPIQSVTTGAPAKEEVRHPVPGEVELGEAEKQLAPYIGANLSEDLTEQGLELNFKEYANGDDKYGIKLCFQGPALNTKAAELGHQVLAALRAHTAFAPLFKHEQTHPRTDKGSEADMMHILIPNLSREQYIQLVDHVRGVVQTKDHGHKTGTAITPQKKEHAEVSAPETAPAPQLPQNTVQTPVAALDKGIANDNGIAPQGVAL